MRPVGEGCKYPNIAAWMHREQMGYVDIANAIGVSTTAIFSALSRTGNSTKFVIDGILRLTGLSYEEAFYLPGELEMGKKKAYAAYCQEQLAKLDALSLLLDDLDVADSDGEFAEYTRIFGAITSTLKQIFAAEMKQC